MDKLEQIKRKYGYVAATTPSNQSNIDSNCHSKIQSISKGYAKPVAERTPLKQVEPTSIKQQNYLQPNSHLYQSQQSKPVETKSQSNEASIGSNKKGEALKQIEVNPNEKANLNQSFVKSYEKTYDLLKNYRNRILTSAEKQKSESKSKLIFNQTTSSSTQNSNIQKSEPKKGQQEEKENFSVSQASQRQSGPKNYPKRCSPLEGIDLKSSVNVYGQIENISRLQSRIHELIKQKSLR